MEYSDLDDAALLPPSFYERGAACVARALLGAVLVSTAEGAITAGRIVETEAYLGSDDPGSHAATKGITERNSVMYGPAGCTYVYFTYGAHYMLNVVTDTEGVAGAVLIRALEPLVGQETMVRRRGRETSLTDGPGKLAQALGVDLDDNGVRLGSGRLAIYEGTKPVGPIERSGRIGLSAGHDLQLRFYENGSKYVSKARIGRRL
ncbi:MAG: DNA-3-methyladenine glycosylase [Coriobacteriia bacterium]|nr:DNA-3-methyladenine glycosylase [Coriobacteriia bacterium]